MYNYQLRITKVPVSWIEDIEPPASGYYHVHSQFDIGNQQLIILWCKTVSSNMRKHLLAIIEKVADNYGISNSQFTKYLADELADRTIFSTVYRPISKEGE